MTIAKFPSVIDDELLNCVASGCRGMKDSGLPLHPLEAIDHVTRCLRQTKVNTYPHISS